MIDLVLRGGLLIGGDGSTPVQGDLAIAGGVIVALGDVSLRGEREERVDGLAVAPGFVDIHSHSDLSLLGDPRGQSKVLQGVTTEVVGNCGLSVAPVADSGVAAMLRPLMTYCDDSRVAWDWTGVAGYLARVADAAPLIDVKILAGHNTIRGSVLGLAARAATASERTRMRHLLDEALTEGAVGLSLGLMYPPSSYADHAELVDLGRTLAAHGAVLATHMADYSSGLLDAVAAMIRIAEESGCRVQISHLAATGRENWGLVARALELVDAAVDRGLDIGVDFYPYLAGSTNLSQLLPPSSLEGGFERMRERVRDSAVRNEVLEHLRGRSLGWDEILLASVPGEPELNGLRIDEGARLRRMAPAEFVLDQLQRSDPTIVAFGRSEGDLRSVMTHPRAVLGSDGLAVETKGTLGGPVPHPRFFGAFPALLGHYVREEGVLTLTEAVRKCTSAPAERVGLRDRGRLLPGLRGDLVVFDPDRIADRSSYTDSRRVPAGIESVYRQGVRIAHRGRVTLDRFPQR